MDKYNKIIQKAFDKQEINEIDLYDYRDIFNIPAGRLVNTLEYAVKTYKGHEEIKEDLFEMNKAIEKYFYALENLQENLAQYLPDRDFRFGQHGNLI